MKKKLVLRKKITETRFNYGLSVSELAIMAGITEEQLIEIESGVENDGFLNSDHCLDCVVGLAKSVGLSEEVFLRSGNEYVFTEIDKKLTQSTENDIKLQDDGHDMILLQRKIEFLKDFALSDEGSETLSDNAETVLEASDKNFTFNSVVAPVALICFYIGTLALHLITEKL
jgi:transcriptional regulator with XRE-family HTH domain